jgi:hypothetical protein
MFLKELSIAEMTGGPDAIAVGFCEDKMLSWPELAALSAGAGLSLPVVLYPYLP